MSGEKACCAHRRVKGITVENDDRTMHDEWHCCDCLMTFTPILKALAAPAQGDVRSLIETVHEAVAMSTDCEGCQIAYDAIVKWKDAPAPVAQDKVREALEAISEAYRRVQPFISSYQGQGANIAVEENSHL